MEIRLHLGILLAFCLVAVGMLHAQSPAALDKLTQKYGPEQVAEIKLNTHYKYESMLLFYAASFRVTENGVDRAATEQEIALIDLDAYNSLRQEKTGVVVRDADLGKDIVLLSRFEFENLLLAQLGEVDRAAYLAYKQQAQSGASKSTDQ